MDQRNNKKLEEKQLITNKKHKGNSETKKRKSQ